VHSLKRIDLLFFSYLLISSLFLALSWDGSTIFYSLVFIRILLAPTLLAIIYWGSKSKHPLINLLRNSYPLILSGYFYSETVYYNKLLFNNIDPYLIAVEEGIFGMQASVEFSQYFSSPIFSELMYFSYFSFYLLIFSYVLVIYFQRREYFMEGLFNLSASLYIFYLIFCILPSAGPQFYFNAPENILPDAYLFGPLMHFIQDMAEQATGAFPSSHVGISVIILMLSKKSAPLFFKITLPLVILLILSTVYIKAHYAIDILGGLLIAPIVLYLSKFLYHFSYFKSHKN